MLQPTVYVFRASFSIIHYCAKKIFLVCATWCWNSSTLYSLVMKSVNALTCFGSCKLLKHFFFICHVHSLWLELGKTCWIAFLIASSLFVTTDQRCLLYIARRNIYSIHVYISTDSATNSAIPRMVVIFWWFTPTNITNGFSYAFFL